MKKTINIFLAISIVFFGVPVFLSGPAFAQVDEEKVCYEIYETEEGDQYASNVVAYEQGLQYNGQPVKAVRSVPEQGLKFEAGNNESNFFSLGFGGWIVVEFDYPIFNGTGTDLKITEDTWGGGYPLEKAEILVSQNGIDFESLGIADNTNLSIIHTTSEFDLPASWEWAKYVKILDVSEKSDFDSYSGRNAADGYDLNAVEALYSGAEVPCEVPVYGCTLTQGYWKTHSVNGPAPYDETWAEIGEDEDFFLSGKSYYEVLWAAPKGGNVYYILAHQYIAAELNMLNEASVPDDVKEAFNEATDLFEGNTPDDTSGLKGKNGSNIKKEWNNLAGILADYNEGLIGPGHCDKEDYKG